MASARSQEPMCKIVQDRVLTLETEVGSKQNFIGMVLMKNEILVTDSNAWNLQMYNRQDGKLMYATDRLDSRPYGVCNINDTKVAVGLDDGKIVILCVMSNNDVESVKTLTLNKTLTLRRIGFDFHCQSMINWNSDKIIVSGCNSKDGLMLSWCILSIKEEQIGSMHNICQVKGIGSWYLYGETHLAVKNNTLFVSCDTSDITENGVYAFDILNPHKHIFLYEHQELKRPWSIMVDNDYVYVCDRDSKTIHQLTDSGQLLTIHSVSSRNYGIFYDDQTGVLYTTDGSQKISTYKIVYSHRAGIPVEILNMDERSIQVFEDALKDGKERIFNIRIMVVGHFNVGKSTLVRRLLGDNVNISERCSTEGIDVYVNFCDVSLLTNKWTKQEKDSEHDYTLRRLVKLLNENYQTGSRAVENDLITPQQKKTEQNSTNIDADYDTNIEIIYQHSHQNNGQSFSSIPTIQNEPTSTDVRRNQSQLEKETMTERKDPMMKMLKLLKDHQYKAIKDVEKYARLSIWDFAGQYAFYTTHQMFLTQRAIYLMVANVSGQFNDIVEDDCYLDTKGKIKCKVHELMDVWMNSIHSCAPPDTENLNASSSTSSYTVIPPPVILVGTHVDQIKQRNPHKHGLKYLEEIRSYLENKPVVCHLVDEVFALDNSIVDSRLEDLKRKIVDVASQQSYWGKQIPTRWFLLEQQLMSLRDAGMKVISRNGVEELNKKETVQIKNSEELDLFLTYLHEIGTIIYFSIEILRDNIILAPQWLIDALKMLINSHLSLPESLAVNGPQSSIPNDNGSQPHIPNDRNVGDNYHSNISTDSDIRKKWSDFKGKGILTIELVDAIWTQDKHPDLHKHRDHLLRIMEQLNIIARPRSFSEIGEKIENYFLVPSMLRDKSPRDIIFPEKDPLVVSTPFLCCVFTEKFLPAPIFHRLAAACTSKWPVAKNMETSENLIFIGSCVFNLDLYHRLILHYKNYIVFARITRFVVSAVESPDAKLCSRVRKFITLNLSKITSCFGQNLKYELHSSRSPTEDGSTAPFQMWCACEEHDSDAPIKPEHMYHARINVALVTVCANALRQILLTCVPIPYSNIYQALLANIAILTSRTRNERGQWQNALLNRYQCQVVFPDPNGLYVGTVDQFDVSLLYVLIRNISVLSHAYQHWGTNPAENPTRDRSLGASVERIRTLRNEISHSIDGELSQDDFAAFWIRMAPVLDDIDQALGRQEYTAQLERQRIQVISVYEAY